MKDEYDFTHAEQGKFYLPIDSFETGIHAKKVPDYPQLSAILRHSCTFLAGI